MVSFKLEKFTLSASLIDFTVYNVFVYEFVRYFFYISLSKTDFECQ